MVDTPERQGAIASPFAESLTAKGNSKADVTELLELANDENRHTYRSYLDGSDIDISTDEREEIYHYAHFNALLIAVKNTSRRGNTEKV